MSFISFDFILYFPIVVVLYYLVPRKIKWIYLLTISYLFYINWQPVYAIFLFISSSIAYLIGLCLNKIKDNRLRKLLLGFGNIFLLCPLIQFKYYGFITDTVHNFLYNAGIELTFPTLQFLLPIGISFYTFMIIGYLIDVYKGIVAPESNYGLFLLFASFFPQITSGPIGRANQLIPQFRAAHKMNVENVLEGIKLMVWGYFMKVCVADRLGIYVDTVYGNLDHHNGTTILFAAILYSFQIYGDFGGYSLIAIGCARAMGIKLIDNFRRPYFAKSIKEFWARWHISLSTWFRDYVYIPLGGNRVSKFRHKINLLITFLVSGLWHGAAWNFILWGGIHGVGQIVENSVRFRTKRVQIIKWGNVFNIFSTFIGITFAWMFFRLSSPSDINIAFTKILRDQGKPFIDVTALTIALIPLAILIFKELKDEMNWNIKFLHSNNLYIVCISITLIIVLIILFGNFDTSSFIYFQF